MRTSTGPVSRSLRAGPDVGLSVRAAGFGTSLQALGAVTPRSSANRVTYTRAAFSEWYSNGPLGLEQGFTVPRAPAAHRAGQLTLSMTLSGNAHASLAPDRRSVMLSSSGGPSLRYTGLTATDARGHALPASLVLDGNRIMLRVNARGARYPVRIDPFIQQGEKLTASGESGKGFFGFGVALSSDGNTALIGGFSDDAHVGAAWVFTRSGASWSQQGEKLTGSGESGKGFFGLSVALSSDGNTALIGGPEDHEGVGAAWVFTRSESTWTQQGEKLIGSGASGEGRAGESVALSSDGNTALIGAPEDNAKVGAAWVFTRSESTWTQQGEKLTAGGESGKAFFGFAVALASAGNTALIGGPEDGEGVGAAWVFTRSESTWTQQNEKLTGGGELGKGLFGSSVALSGDGNTALVGAPEHNTKVGGAWVFTRSESIWTQQGERLAGAGENGQGHFGASVALSSDGNTALIGAYANKTQIGAAWVFTRSESTWTQEGEKLTGSDEIGTGRFGESVALSGDGSTALIGGLKDNVSIGAAWVFSRSPTVTKLKPNKGRAGGGTSVTVTGRNFIGATAVRFGTENATSFTVNSESSITAVSPAGAGTVDVTVSNASGTSATSSVDQFSYLPAPSVIGVSPSSGPTAGATSVSISGTNFTGATAVKFGSLKAKSFVVNSEGSITAVSPAGTGTVDVTVIGPGGTSATSSADQFNYLPAPTVTGVVPNQGPVEGGTSVSISGTNFGGVTAVRFGSEAATSFTVNSEGSISAVSPAQAAGTVDVTVTSPGGASAPSTADHFKFLPTVTGVNPNTGSKAGGTSVTVTGSGFVPGSTATIFAFGVAKGTSVECSSTTTCTVVSPAHTATTVDVVATVNKASSVKNPPADQFTFN